MVDQADKAKLTNDRMLYLYGHVEVNAWCLTLNYAELPPITRRLIW